MKFILYINWWVGRTCLVLLSIVMRTLYHMFLRFFFNTNLKFWPSFKPMIILSLSERWSFEEKKNLVVCSYEDQTLRNSCIASLLTSQQFLERTGEVLRWNDHFTKIIVLPHISHMRFFFERYIEKSISWTCENYFLYKLENR